MTGSKQPSQSWDDGSQEKLRRRYNEADTSTWGMLEKARDERNGYTWQNWLKIRAGRASEKEKLAFLAGRDGKFWEKDCELCEQHVRQLFTSSPLIRFLREEIAKLGPDIRPQHISCIRCPIALGMSGEGLEPVNISAGFDPQSLVRHDQVVAESKEIRPVIKLCANYLRTRDRVEDTLAHELIHAYDWSRWKVEVNNPLHQACTEIRASTLSGECRWMREFQRASAASMLPFRFPPFTRHFQACVKRRSILSLLARKDLVLDNATLSKIHTNGEPTSNCTTNLTDSRGIAAAQLVDLVWDKCFVDTRPFDEIYR